MLLTHDEVKTALVNKWESYHILRSKWINALIRGPFRQGYKAMLRDGLYCPLGVLCSVAGLEAEFPFGPTRAARFNGLASALPTGLADFMRMTEYGDFRHAVPATWYVKVPRQEWPSGSIISLNDSARWTFRQIGEYLAAHETNLRSYNGTQA